MDQTEILAELRPSVPRRIFAALVLYGLALLLLWLSFLGSFPFLARMFLLALAIGAFFLAERQRRIWGQAIYLTEAGLFTSEGAEIAALDQITSVDRGMLAFKPSQGFILRLKDRHSFSWAPGLWWRNGRRAGIGGITPAAHGKFMAERLAILLAGDEVFNPFAGQEPQREAPPPQPEPEPSASEDAAPAAQEPGPESEPAASPSEPEPGETKDPK